MISIRPRSIALILTSVLALSSAALAQRTRSTPNLGEMSTVEFELRRWRSDLASELRLSAGGAAGATVDPLTDLGLPAERTWDYHFAVRLFSRLKARGNWFKTKYEGSSLAASELCIAGLCTPAGVQLATSLELEQTRGGAELDVVRGAYGILAVVGEYGRFRARTGFESTAGTASPAPLDLDLPLFGVKGRAYLTPALAITVEGVGMKRESRGVWTDFDGYVTYNAVPNLAFSYGYRNTYARFKAIEPEGDRAVVRLRGQYFSVTVRF